MQTVKQHNSEPKVGFAHSDLSLYFSEANPVITKCLHFYCTDSAQRGLYKGERDTNTWENSKKPIDGVFNFKTKENSPNKQ